MDGAISHIQRESGVSYPTALRTLQGKSQNQKVLKAVAAYIKEYKELQNTIANIIL